MRIGQGFDIHRLQPGEYIVIGGVKIACQYTVIAHSDGDVLIHALCDALFGAVALGDIGTHFPDDEEKWKGVDSRIFLRTAVQRVAQMGYAITNMDSTLFAEYPKLMPYIQQMRIVLAHDMNIPIDAVSIKAKTAERLGVIGEHHAIAASAVVSLSPPAHE